MKSKNILAVQVAILTCGLVLAPSQAKHNAKAKITELKLNVNYATDNKIQSVDGPTPSHMSDTEMQKVTEMKSKFADSIEPKMTELHSLHRQMFLSMTKPTVDRTQIIQLQSRINSINSDIANCQLNFHLDLNDGLPSDAKETLRKHLLFDAAFGPEMSLGGPTPPGLGPPPTCAPLPGFGLHHPPFGPPPIMGFPPGFRTE